MTNDSPSWRQGLLLTGSAWLVTVVLLIVAITRYSLDRSGELTVVTFWLAMSAAAVAVVTAAFALRGLRRQQRIQAELRRSQDTFSGILTIAADAIITIDERQRILHFNHGAEATFGYAAADVMGQPLDVLIPERYRRGHETHVQGFSHAAEVARRMGERRQIFGLRRDGTEFPAEASISRLESGDARIYSVVLRDTSARVRAEERQRFLTRATADLMASLEPEATYVAAVHAGVPQLADCAILDLVEPGGEVRRVVSVHDDPGRTRALRRLEGRASPATRWPFRLAEVLAGAEPIVRRGLAAGWLRPGAEDPVRLADWEALQAHTVVSIGLRVRDHVLGAITLLMTDPAREFTDEDLPVARALAERIAVAVDNARLYQEARRASQTRDELLGIVSHDLRNPLSAISMCSRVLAEKPPDSGDDRAELANAILDSVALMQRLIQDLLDVATIESGHLRIALDAAEPSEVGRRALAMVREQAAERGVDLVANVPAGLAPLQMDAMRVEQVIANLLGNAVKFTDRGGKVTLAMSRANGRLHVSVTDTGIGIPPEAIPHIFDRFWHARRSGRTVGTGLGLAIAKGIVVAHGGTLDVASTVGEGTTFSFHLPEASVPPDDETALTGTTAGARPANAPRA